MGSSPFKAFTFDGPKAHFCGRWFKSGPARRGLSVPVSGVAVAMLTLLRQPFWPVLWEANGFRGSRYSWCALYILDVSAQRPKSCHCVKPCDY